MDKQIVDLNKTKSKLNDKSLYVLQDLTHLDFSLSQSGAGCVGSFYKAYDDMFYYKASYFFNDKFGYEAVNEVIASRLSDCLKFDNARYELVYAKIKIADQEYKTYICKSRNYRKPEECRLTIESYMQFNNMKKGCVQELKDESFFNDVLNTILLDYIIDNRDRHGANLEILVHQDSNRLAPIFDCGSSLLAPCQYDMDRVAGFHLLHNGPINNFLISPMWNDVLETLKAYDVRVKDIDWNQLDYKDLYQALDKEILDREMIMIKERYDHAKKILNT